MRKLLATLLVSASTLILAAAPAAANHSWGNYHWARQTPTFSLRLADHMTNGSGPYAWKPKLLNASSDWSQSSVLDTNIFGSTITKNCKAVSRQVDVCNGRYGYNGWLGIAQIWISGSHITAGTVKANDTYLANTTRYKDPARQHVLCQEVGHTLGLDHQDESGADLDTCMDYSDKLDNPHPNAHDYQQLETIYKSHTDSTTTATSSTATSGAKGRVKRVKHDLYVEDFGNGNKRFVWVHWKDKAASEAAPKDRTPE